MKKFLFVLSILVVIKTNLHAQSAVALFKPTISGDEHYGFSTGNTLYEAKQKALDELASTVAQKEGSRASGQQYVYTSTSKKGGYAIGRGKDQYGHYWHYEAAVGYDDEDTAKQHVLERLAARGLYDTEIVYSGTD
jgi:hypothetical protein